MHASIFYAHMSDKPTTESEFDGIISELETDPLSYLPQGADWATAVGNEYPVEDYLTDNFADYVNPKNPLQIIITRVNILNYFKNRLAIRQEYLSLEETFLKNGEVLDISTMNKLNEEQRKLYFKNYDLNNKFTSIIMIDDMESLTVFDVMSYANLYLHSKEHHNELFIMTFSNKLSGDYHF